ncbi:YbaB/EbfC family nucleoid-associated protein [Corynebacterium sp. 320]|uniref:Nucleoid-associated protein F8377_08975 n=1 Tax=Corynebacterium zhongnanshanii TaxID=2768834 RepID=A0ABQ6VBL2_9CORY|nr:MULTISPECIES: YbaB/EbfC family nucleoid-associated protein [Corynebacterium]KAB1502851.1 YbaB/EbfC family nucleoid-associated protein [Corynebacterium sp. 320]KAB1552362.1 YbaB/EbfC family nucleoid-associated protein [Corynebacterium sp. 321]KAB1554423.1 YbaB/EbfC family nucleoid-associated protein [Corynebacterium sp. 319]KAB3519133.1 YbaB/EbfC family nucleoid-associated protein [Corynebacterium zhongnanshanii]KAB3526514.1 YbaB/EbfC family nucleoid-associated protein [Corynebacterium sp. 2
MTQPDMQAIMQQAQQMQAQLQAAQEEILRSTVTGESGNGLVKIEMAGSGSINSLSIDPQVVDPNDVETLQDLVIGAFVDANKNLQSLAEEKMGPLSQGMNSLGL